MSFWATIAVYAGKKLKDKAIQKGKEGMRISKEGVKDMNYMKAPKDSPGEVFKGISGTLNKRPDKINISPGVSKYLKDTFRLK